VRVRARTKTKAGGEGGKRDRGGQGAGESSGRSGSRRLVFVQEESCGREGRGEGGREERQVIHTAQTLSLPWSVVLVRLRNGEDGRVTGGAGRRTTERGSQRVEEDLPIPDMF
jgi:hypothetical protein